MKFTSQLGSFRTNKVQTVVSFTHQNVEFVPLENPKDKQFLSLNPQGKCPILQTPSGVITQSNSIIRFLAESAKQLYGQNAFEKASIDSWLDFCAQELEPICGQLVLPVFGQLPFDSIKHTQALNDLNSVLNVMNENLKKQNFFVGNQISIADIAIASALVNVFRFILQDAFQAQSQLKAWFTGILSIKQFKRVWGTIRPCKTPMAPFQGSKDTPAVKQENPKQEAPKKEANNKEVPKKEVPKKEAPKKEFDDLVEAPKTKNPLDCLPETKFSLYDFKTLIVNAQDKKEAIDFLWKNFDDNGFSFWKIYYEKYEGEGEKLYMTNNLAQGFLQRLENFRKYSFGAWGVYGDEPCLEIRGNFKMQGLLIWRGTTIPAEVLEHPSYEYHTFTRLPFSDPKTKDLVTQYWCGLTEDCKVEGLSVQNVKYFK